MGTSRETQKTAPEIKSRSGETNRSPNLSFVYMTLSIEHSLCLRTEYIHIKFMLSPLNLLFEMLYQKIIVTRNHFTRYAIHDKT